MKAIVLAAGYATRLYPLTLDKPKPLLPIAGKPMLEHVIDKLEHIDALDTIYVVTNEKFFLHFKTWAESCNSTKNIKIINDHTTSPEDRLGALGDIKYAIDQENINDDILIFGGDNLFEDPLLPMYNAFLQKNSSIVAFNDVKSFEIAKRMGVGALNNQQKIVEFVEKPEFPKSTFAATLIYFFKQNDIHLINKCLDESDNGDEVKAGELIAYMIDKTEVHGHVFSKKWFDIGNHEQLKEADEYWSTLL